MLFPIPGKALESLQLLEPGFTGPLGASCPVLGLCIPPCIAGGGMGTGDLLLVLGTPVQGEVSSL